jgi:sugar phosphate isomerase/epimerase
MASGGPRVSISQISTFSAPFVDDVAAYAEAGLDGLGVWELKLGDGPDDAAVEAFRASGLASASAVPLVPSLLPLPLLGGPDDPAVRLDAMLGSLHRLAPFRPSGIVCLTGTGAGRNPDDARSIVVDGLRQLADEASSLGLRVALEPYQRDGGGDWTIVSTIPDALDLVRDAGDSPALGLQFDVWHLWNTETLFEDIAEHVRRFAGVHIDDVRAPTRGWADRVAPGDGIAGVPRILRALDDAGYDGLYDIEIFSDDGTFGIAHEDSLWRLEPRAAALTLREAFDEVWRARDEVDESTLTPQGPLSPVRPHLRRQNSEGVRG